MSEYEIRALDASTRDAFARLVGKHNGCRTRLTAALGPRRSSPGPGD
jgi:hypothetical protein